MKFWIFGIAFLIPSVFEVVISVIDTFDWITFIEPSCNLTTSSADNETVSNILNFISIGTLSWSILTTIVFILVFLVGCCMHIRSKTMLKVLLEISILMTLVGPVSKSSLLLRDCLTGYLIIFLSLLFYSMAIIITAVTTEISDQSLDWKVLYQVSLFVVLTACKAVQILSVVSTFGVFLLISANLSALKYSYFILVIMKLVSMWISNVINRSKYYHLFFTKTFRRHQCIRCYPVLRSMFCVRITDIIVSILNIICCIILLTLTGIYLTHDSLFYVTVSSLSISCLVNCCLLLCKHCFIKDSKETDRTPLIGYD